MARNLPMYLHNHWAAIAIWDGTDTYYVLDEDSPTPPEIADRQAAFIAEYEPHSNHVFSCAQEEISQLFRRIEIHGYDYDEIDMTQETPP